MQTGKSKSLSAFKALRTVKLVFEILLAISSLDESGFCFNIAKTIISVPSTNNTGHFSAELEASLFDEEQTIESTVIYQNGIRQSKAWKLYVKDAATKKEEN